MTHDERALLNGLEDRIDILKDSVVKMMELIKRTNHHFALVEDTVNSLIDASKVYNNQFGVLEATINNLIEVSNVHTQVLNEMQDDIAPPDEKEYIH